MGPKKTATGTEPPAKRRRINTNTSSAVHLNSDTPSSDAIQWLTENITSNIMVELQKVGVLPTQHENMGQRGGADSQNQQKVDSHTDIPTRQEQIPASAVVASEKGLPNIHGIDFHSEYKSLGRPLHTYVTPKKMSNAFVQMSDILDPPTEMDLVDVHLSIKDRGKVELASTKKKTFVTIEEWSDTFCIFSSVLRERSPDNPCLSESLAEYMYLISSIQKDGGD